MKFDFDIGEALGRAAGVASAAAKDVTEAASKAADAAGKAAAGAAQAVSETAGNAAGAVAEGVSAVGERAASSPAGKAVADVADAAGTAAAGAASAVAGKAGDLASGAAAAVDSGVKAIQANTFSARLKRARIEGFKDGIKQGAYLAGEKRCNFYYAYVAALCFFLRCDGDFSDDEQAWLRHELEFLELEDGLFQDAREKIEDIVAYEEISFEDVTEYLDKVSIVSLESIAEHIQTAIEADGKVTADEERAEVLFADYIAARAADASFNEDWVDRAIEESVREYGENLDRIDRDFEEKTGLQGADVPFLIGATMLQVARVIAINMLTEIERANASGATKENALHKVQDAVFGRPGDSGNGESGRLYASKHHILTARGVPYDATSYAGVNDGLFKGANHRFATLGHDPVLGLIFGTSNIMTNSITRVKSTDVFGVSVNVPVTHVVSYDALGKNPRIADPVSTIEMLASSGRRVVDDPKAACAALIKQVIHIGSDLYTPCGIQIPLANLVLDKAHVEKLTTYVSTGDFLKVGVQAGMAVLVNWLIAALHGSSLIFDGDDADFAFEMHQARTKKIVLISNTIATSSSVVWAALEKNPRRLDLGGAAVLAYRLFTDARFISRLKEEYVNSELDKIYDARAEGVL